MGLLVIRCAVGPGTAVSAALSELLHMCSKAAGRARRTHTHTHTPTQWQRRRARFGCCRCTMTRYSPCRQPIYARCGYPRPYCQGTHACWVYARLRCESIIADVPTHRHRGSTDIERRWTHRLPLGGGIAMARLRACACVRAEDHAGMLTLCARFVCLRGRVKFAWQVCRTWGVYHWGLAATEC